jgi:hypothetical protein
MKSDHDVEYVGDLMWPANIVKPNLPSEYKSVRYGLSSNIWYPNLL